MASRYWAIKNMGTVESLAEEYRVSKPTLIKYAMEHMPVVNRSLPLPEPSRPKLPMTAPEPILVGGIPLRKPKVGALR
jgi:hypothetical protein